MSAGDTESKTNELTALTLSQDKQDNADQTLGTEPEDVPGDGSESEVVAKTGELLVPAAAPAPDPAAASGGPGVNRALSLASARGFRHKMVRWRRHLNHIK